MKTLVAYFSVQGTTAKVAKELAEHLNADLFEIKPLHPYTDADIKWTNPLARCNREKLGNKDVPVAGGIPRLPDLVRLCSERCEHLLQRIQLGGKESLRIRHIWRQRDRKNSREAEAVCERRGFCNCGSGLERKPNLE